MLLDRKFRLSWGATLAVLALGIVVALPMASLVWAHKVNVFAWIGRRNKPWDWRNRFTIVGVGECKLA